MLTILAEDIFILFATLIQPGVFDFREISENAPNWSEATVV